MHRIMRRAALGAAFLMLTVGVPVSADTTGDNGNLDVSYASSDDGAVYVELDRDNFTGNVGLVARLDTSTQIVCDDGSAGWIYTDWYGSGAPATYAFGRR